MKNKICLILFLFFCYSLTPLVAQNTIAILIQQLQSKYKVQIAIDPALLQYKIEDMGANNDLTQLLKGIEQSGFDFYMVNKGYVLIRKSNETALPLSTAETRPAFKKLNGRIVDAADHKPLPFASVYTDDLSFGTYTDEQGYYSLSLPSDKEYKLVCSYVGYETMPVSIEDPTALKPTIFQIDSVAIIASPIKSLDHIGFSQNYLSSVYTIYNIDKQDLTRLLQQNVAGIVQNNSSLILRSMKQDKTLVLIDGMPAVQGGHFFNTISNYNEVYFDQIEVYKNQQPIQYTNSTAGIIDYSSKKNAGTNFSSISNLIYSGIGIRSSGSKLDLHLGGRVSYLGLNKKGILGKNLDQLNLRQTNQNSEVQSSIPTTDFYDINGAVSYALTKNSKLKASIFTSKDNSTAEWQNQFKLPLHGKNLNLFQNNINTQTQSHLSSGLAYEHKINDRIRLNGEYTYYTYSDYFNLGTSTKLDYNAQVDLKKSSYIHDQTINSNWLHAGVQIAASPQEIWKLGITNLSTALSFDSQENDRHLTSLNDRVNNFSIYGEYQYVKNKQEVRAGFKISKYNNFEKLYFEPSIAYHYRWTPRLTSKIGYSYKTQNLGLLDFETRFAQNLSYYYVANENLSLQKSHQLFAGFNYKKKQAFVDLEGYLYDNTGNQLFANNFILPKRDDPKPLPPNQDTYQFYKGTNYIIGVDLSVGHRWQKIQLNGNYTLSKSIQKFEGIYNDRDLPSPNDRRHILGVNGKYFLNRTTFGIYLSYSSGAPYLSFQKFAPDKKKMDYNRGDVTSYLPDYFSMDLYVRHALKIQKAKVTFGIDLYNATNHTNVKAIQQTGGLFDPKILKGQKPIVLTNQTLMLGRFINFSIGVNI